MSGKYWKHNNDILEISDQFIYEVDLFKYEDSCWNLEDTRKYGSDKFIENIVEFEKWIYEGFKLFKITTLLYAPLDWLENNAIKIEYQTPKEKRKQKLKEKNDTIK